MKKTEANKIIKEFRNRRDVEVNLDGANRARSVTVGMAFGGVLEICMRKDDGTTWAVMQPVEAIELAHQIAAAVGCHIAMRPREDFGSWRSWNSEKSQEFQFPEWPAHPPQVEAKPPPVQLPAPEKQAGLKLNRSNKNVVATKKTVNGRSIKRASKSS
jgi:hypothetical protein